MLSKTARRKIESLLELGRTLESRADGFVEQWGGGKDAETGVVHFPYPQYPADVLAFFETLGSDSWWFDRNYRMEELQSAIENDGYIARASLAEVRSLLTYCTRGEKFCDGFWGGVLETGRVRLILARLRALLAEAPQPLSE